MSEPVVDSFISWVEGSSPQAPGRQRDTERFLAEIARLRLTRGERQAIEFCIGAHPLDDSIPETLRALLERLG